MSISALVIKNEFGEMEVCEVFPAKIPAIEINDGGKVLFPKVCSMNASLAIYLNLLADKVQHIVRHPKLKKSANLFFPFRPIPA
jgi:hypothetical protein